MRRYKSHIAIFCFILFVFPVVAKQMHALIHSSENHCNEHHVVHLHESEHNCFLCDYVPATVHQVLSFEYSFSSSFLSNYIFCNHNNFIRNTISYTLCLRGPPVAF
jgi:hypothetical protein